MAPINDSPSKGESLYRFSESCLPMEHDALSVERELAAGYAHSQTGVLSVSRPCFCALRRESTGTVICWTIRRIRS